MQMQHARVSLVRIPGLFLCQLLLSFLGVGTTVILLNGSLGLLASLCLGCLLGLLLTANIAQALFTLHVALERLALDLPITLLAPYRYWPLQTLFRSLTLLQQQCGGKSIRGQQSAQYEDQLVQQVMKTAAQEERNRLARDLHDSIKQQIFSITMSAAAAKVRWQGNRERVLAIIEDIERLAYGAQVEMQAMLQQLKPEALENTGLIESLRTQCQALEYRSGAKVFCDITSLPAEELLPAGTHEVIFRIVQEGLANIARHARATTAWVSLYQQNQQLMLEIGDDGQGFDLAATTEQSGVSGMGLKNIAERIRALRGQLRLWSMVGQGTTLHIAIPFVARSQSALNITESIDPGIVQTAKESMLAHRIGSGALEVAALCMLLAAPVQLISFLIPACLLTALVMWLWSHYQRLSVAVSAGRDHERYLYLRATSYQLLGNVLMVVMLSLGYIIPVWQYRLWLTIPLTGIGILYGLYIFTTERYCRKVALEQLQQRIQQQRQQLIIDLSVWILTIGYAFYAGLITFTWQSNADHWTADVSLLLGVLWFVILCAKGLQTLRWQHLVDRRIR
jgi:Signal transduction histidine kinase